MMKYPLRAAIAALIAAASLTLSPTALAQGDYESKVDLRFDRYYDYEEMTQALKDLCIAYPKYLKLTSLGLSVGGRELWVVTLNNPETGSDRDKPAMWIDGNIHGNEVQAAETVLYSIWYLMKSYGHIEKLTKLVDERAFYFMPMVNPDGRDVWFHQGATPHYLRGGIKPTDNDHDGENDEDGYDDLDGDGHITQMWIADPLGRFKRDPEDDRFFIRVDADDPPGGWSFLGSEGIDNDGDGRINEDGLGGYDPNRNWPSDWQPDWIQGGAGDYPLSLPESEVIAKFLIDHPNIAAFQSYHNTGGMILRGPGAEYVSYPREDIRVYDTLGREGENILPFYRYMIIHADLYTVHGGMVNFAYEGLGIFAYTNELWNDAKMFYDAGRTGEEDTKKFRDLLQFGDVYVPYKEFDHPQFGPVLIGGTKKYASRVTPPWHLEETCHRNFAFTMYHADQMPQVEWGYESVKPLDSGLWEVTLEIKNTRATPTISAMARQNRIGSRDLLSASFDEEAGISIATSGTIRSLVGNVKLDAVERQPHRLWVDGGIGGQGAELFRFLIQGPEGAEVRFTYESDKGGTIEKSVTLEETSE